MESVPKFSSKYTRLLISCGFHQDFHDGFMIWRSNGFQCLVHWNAFYCRFNHTFFIFSVNAYCLTTNPLRNVNRSFRFLYFTRMLLHLFCDFKHLRLGVHCSHPLQTMDQAANCMSYSVNNVLFNYADLRVFRSEYEIIDIVCSNSRAIFLPTDVLLMLMLNPRRKLHHSIQEYKQLTISRVKHCAAQNSRRKHLFETSRGRTFS